MTYTAKMLCTSFTRQWSPFCSRQEKRSNLNFVLIQQLSYFRPTKFKTHYVAPQFFIFQRTVQIAFIEMRTYLSFGLILRDIPNSITSQNTLRLLPILVGLLVLPCTRQCRRSPHPLLPPHPFFFLSRTEEPAKAGTCARDKRAIQQLALNVHVKQSDLT